VSRFVKFVLALGALRGLRKRRRERKLERERQPERIVAAGEAQPRAELGVGVLLLLCAAFAIAFIVVYAVDGIGHKTQLEGVALGGALLFLSAALIVTARGVVVTEEVEEPYPGAHPEEQEEVAQIVQEAGTPITRKKLLGGAAVAAGGALGAALVAPAASLGPVLSSHVLLESPWRRGRRVVREDNVPVKASDIEQGTFYTGFPAGASHDLLGSPVLIVRLDPKELKLPAGREAWAPQGIVAYSKICTHAGCAINLYRKPTFPPVEPKPAFVCPCHYSTFDPATGGTVLFGPAGRELPQLPLTIDRKGNLRAGGNFSGPPGPSWWGVRLWKARFVKG
jgi:ubiquinol-cytochrome c reductase iron-sulfur subunit